MDERAPHKHRMGGGTGPRTREGKARSSQNARKHGLAAAEPTQSLEAERLIRLIAGETCRDPVLLEAAASVAEAQLRIRQVRLVRTDLARTTRSMEGLSDASISQASPPSSDLLREMEGFDRYERRALSRRKFAIRRFHALVTAAADTPGTRPRHMSASPLGRDPHHPLDHDCQTASERGSSALSGADGGGRALMSIAALGQHDVDLEPVDAVGPGRPSRR